MQTINKCSEFSFFKNYNLTYNRNSNESFCCICFIHDHSKKVILDENSLNAYVSTYIAKISNIFHKNPISEYK